MRDVEFRGKDVISNEWVYGYLVIDTDTNYPAYIVERAYWNTSDGLDIRQETTLVHEVDYESVGQYTGLVDTKGKKVYSSDIYKNYDNGCIGVLSYDQFGLFTSEYKDGILYNNLPFRELDTTNFEVIGNKCENPELLEI